MAGSRRPAPHVARAHPRAAQEHPRAAQEHPRAARNRLNTAWDRVHPALAAVTGPSWALVAAGVGSGVLAVAAGWREAAVVAVVAACCLLVGIASVIGRTSHRVRVDLPQERTVAGRTAVGGLTVTNTRGRRIVPGVIELVVGGGAAQFLVPSLGPHEEWSEVFAVPTRHRGVIGLGPARSVRGDALGLVRRVREWSAPVLLHVHPRTVRVRFDATGFQADTEGVTTAKLSSSDVSFHALRDYAPGDDRRHVHWATSARLGRLVVRQYEETRRSHHVILLDTDLAHWSPDAFEIAVSVTASLALAGVGPTRRVSVATSAGRISTATPVRMLDELAELHRATEPTDFTRREQEVLADEPGASAVTVVVGPLTEDATIMRLAVLGGADRVVTAVRVRPGRSPRRFRIGGAEVLDCPDLVDLPRLVASLGAGVRG